MKYAVLYGSVRTERRGIGLAKWLVKKLEDRGHEATLLDPKELEIPMLDKMHKEYNGNAPGDLEKIHAILQSADGFVIVTGEYNHSIPPAMKNLLDTFQQEYLFKPAGIASYSKGPFAGVRVAPHMRAILGELGMVTPSIMFSVSKVGESFDTDGNILNEDYERRVSRFLDELEWYTEALTEKRKERTPY